MMQPVGGMGRIGEAFGRKLGGVIRYGAEVVALRRNGDGRPHRLARRSTGGAERAIEAPLVVVTIPFPVLRDIPADFSPDIRAAIEAVDYVPAVKVAFQAERRFWELDDGDLRRHLLDHRDITQVWYPTAGIHQRKGILVGAYIWSEDIGEKFTAMLARSALAAAWPMASGCIPNVARHLTQGRLRRLEEHSVQPVGLGGMEPGRAGGALRVLLKGDGPFLFAGEHMSYINGWQEGAVRSAHRALDQVAERTQPAK